MKITQSAAVGLLLFGLTSVNFALAQDRSPAGERSGRDVGNGNADKGGSGGEKAAKAAAKADDGKHGPEHDQRAHERAEKNGRDDPHWNDQHGTGDGKGDSKKK